MEEKKSKSELREKIWKIRDLIQELEDVKDKIIDYLNLQKNLNSSAKKMWISDIKELYYNIVAAWQMLSSASDGDLKCLDSSKSFLFGARNRLAQSTSEIKSFKNEKASELDIRIKCVFDRCWDEFVSVIEKLTPKKAFEKPIKKIIKVSNSEYNLPCSVCGDISVIFRIGITRFNKRDSLIFRGITHETSLELSYAKKLFDILEKEDLLGVHNFMKEHHGFEGLDAYCPKCDKIYCWEHYNAQEVFDEGFYDCTYGICPNGHKRMIDD